MFIIITSMKHLPVPTRSNVRGAPAAPPPLLVHGGPPPLSPHLKISKYCPHQSLEFSWQQGKWGRRGWLGSRIIIQIPRSKKKKSGGWREIMASLCGGRRQGEGGGGLADTWDSSCFPRGGWCAWWQLTEGCCLPPEGKKSLPSGWTSACLTHSHSVCSAPSHQAHASPVTPSSGSLTRIMSLPGCSLGFLA